MEEQPLDLENAYAGQVGLLTFESHLAGLHREDLYALAPGQELTIHDRHVVRILSHYDTPFVDCVKAHYVAALPTS